MVMIDILLGTNYCGTLVHMLDDLVMMIILSDLYELADDSGILQNTGNIPARIRVYSTIESTRYYCNLCKDSR